MGKLDLININDSYGLWRVIANHIKSEKVLCQCECGTQKLVRGYDLISSKTNSCGCTRTKRIASYKLSHGLHGTPGYETWKNMRNRCNNPNNVGYKNYGGRGIKVCERWDDYNNFIKDMGPPPSNMSLDRIDNDGNYEPNNCRWATKEQQSQNRRWKAKPYWHKRSNKWVVAFSRNKIKYHIGYFSLYEDADIALHQATLEFEGS